MATLGSGFYNKLLQVSSNVGMKPEDILNVMALESGLNPEAKHRTSGASGLVQFMPSTLKNLGFKGSAGDFRELSAEAQLDWVEKLIKDNMRFNGGQPFTSPAQYYVANFVPAALRIPGIKSGDPTTIIAAKNPTVAHMPGVGIKEEANIYRSNPVLDVDKDGAITYGDIQTVMKNTAAGRNFQQAVADMRNYTGYQPKASKTPSSAIAVKDDFVKRYMDRISGIGDNKVSTPSPKYTELNTILDNYLKQLAASETRQPNSLKIVLSQHRMLALRQIKGQS